MHFRYCFEIKKQVFQFDYIMMSTLTWKALLHKVWNVLWAIKKVCGYSVNSTWVFHLLPAFSLHYPSELDEITKSFFLPYHTSDCCIKSSSQTFSDPYPNFSFYAMQFKKRLCWSLGPSAQSALSLHINLPWISVFCICAFLPSCILSPGTPNEYVPLIIPAI